MTNEEAKREIKKLEKCHYEKPNGDSDLRVYEALAIAVEAIDKQIPKKPMEKDGWIACPNCEISMSGRMYFPWCDNCGQALDWRDENE